MPEKKKIVKKSIKTKKIATNAAVMPRAKKPKPEKVVKKTTKKTKVKKTGAGKISTKRETVKKTKKALPPKSTVKELKEVKLPENASLRSIAKARAITENLDEYIARSVYRVAVVSAACFLIVGSTMAIADILPSGPSLSTLISGNGFNTAQVIGANSTINSISGVEKVSVLPAPEFSLLTSMPEVITEDFRVSFTADNAREIKIILHNYDRGFSTELPYTTLLDNKYRAVVEVDSYEYGYYKLEFRLVGENESKSIIRYSKEFLLGNSPETVEIKDTVPGEIVEKIEIKSDLPKTEASSSIVLKDEQEVLQRQKEVLKQKEPLEKPELLDISLTKESLEKSTFGLLIENDSDNVATLKVISDSNKEYIEVYVRPINSLREQFVTLASKRGEYWYASVNKNNLPAGEYEIFAKANLSGVIRNSSGASLTVKKTDPINSIVTTNNAITDPKREINTPVIEDAPVVRSAETAEVKNIRQFASTSLNNIDRNLAITEANDALLTNQDQLSKLMSLYAIAVQSEDQMLIKKAEDNLSEFRRDVVEKMSVNSERAILMNDIDSEISTSIEGLKTKTRTFENLRRESTRGESSVDTDNDGVTDFDEINLYGTDPNLPDSDQDGVLDGVEIINQFDPLNASPEAIIKFASPKSSTGLITPELSVESIEPVVPLSDDAPVKAEIRGKALPNSFVTIFIFSNPIVVTVRTDADGSFVYTLDKELDDGQHEVFVAVTDNTGSIIAQSNPFSFVKVANAFSPVEDDEPVTQLQTSVVDEKDSGLGLIVGMSIISFGLILLLLGVGIKGKREDNDEVSQPKNNLETV